MPNTVKSDLSAYPHKNAAKPNFRPSASRKPQKRWVSLCLCWMQHVWRNRIFLWLFTDLIVSVLPNLRCYNQFLLKLTLMVRFLTAPVFIVNILGGLSIPIEEDTPLSATFDQISYHGNPINHKNHSSDFNNKDGV